MGPALTSHGSRNGSNATVAATYCGEAYFGSRLRAQPVDRIAMDAYFAQ